MALGVIAAVAGVQALSGVAQYYQSEKARKASSSKLREIENLFNSIKPPELDLTVNDPPELIEESVPPTDFDMSRIEPEQYQQLQEFVPEVAPYIEEARPDLVQDSAVGLEGLEAQRSALRRLRQVESGDDPAMAAKLRQSTAAGQQASQSRMESILQDAARRGRRGSGAELAAQMQGSSDAQMRASQQGDMAAIESYRQGLQAMRDSSSLGGQMRGQELSKEQMNNQLLNQYNQRMTAGYQNYLDRSAQQRNQAEMFNQQGRQAAADANVGARNQADVRNQEYLNRLRQSQRGEQLGERDYQNQIAMQKAQWGASERDRQNQLKQQQFNNQMAQTSGRAGIAQTQAQNAMQAAADRNRMIGGLANAGTQAGMGYMQYRGQQDALARSDQRHADYMKRMDRNADIFGKNKEDENAWWN